MQNLILKDRLDQLLQQMRELYDGDLWYGTTLMPVLKQITPELSATPPIHDVHCIQQIVIHMNAWRKVLVEKLNGNIGFRIEVNSDQDWTPQEEINDENWSSVLSEFQNGYLNMLSLLEKKATALLDKEVEGAGYDFQYLIEGILHHDIYHLGQIALVRKILKVQEE